MSEKISKNHRSSLLDLISRLSSPAFIVETLKFYGFSFKKRFGQHFLINKSLLDKIIEWSNLDMNDIVIEVGPGIGVLTVYLSIFSKQVISIEIDSGFYRYLSRLISEYRIENVELLHTDFMDICRSGIIGPDILTRANKMVSNFPFCIANRAILQTLVYLHNIDLIAGMVQQESAERILAKPGTKNYSFLSVIIQTAAEVEVLKKSISPNSFFPPPGVKSSFVRLRRKIGVEREWLIGFLKFLKVSFSQRRKTIVKNITNGFYINEEKLKKVILKVSGKINVRAEELSPQTFSELYNELKNDLRKNY